LTFFIAESGGAVNICAAAAVALPSTAEASAAIRGFVHETIPSYSLDDFKSHFRMARAAF